MKGGIKGGIKALLLSHSCAAKTLRRAFAGCRSTTVAARSAGGYAAFRALSAHCASGRLSYHNQSINKTIIRKHSIVVAKFFAIGIDDGIQHLADMIEQSFSSSATFPLLPVSPGSDELGGSSTS